MENVALTRREVLLVGAAALTLTPLGLRVRRRGVCRLGGVSIGMAPLLSRELHAGAGLEVHRRHGLECVYLDEHLLGWLPRGASGVAPAHARIHRIGTDRRHRMTIDVVLLDV